MIVAGSTTIWELLAGLFIPPIYPCWVVYRLDDHGRHLTNVRTPDICYLRLLERRTSNSWRQHSVLRLTKSWVLHNKLILKSVLGRSSFPQHFQCSSVVWPSTRLVVPSIDIFEMAYLSRWVSWISINHVVSRASLIHVLDLFASLMACTFPVQIGLIPWSLVMPMFFQRLLQLPFLISFCMTLFEVFVRMLGVVSWVDNAV